MSTELTKGLIVELLRDWIKQRPGLEFCNYGDVSSYRSELRGITEDRHDAERLLNSVEYSGITAEELKAAFEHAYSGRLSLTENSKGEWMLEYCTGQYWPTEYRAAVCAVLASALWNYHRLDYQDAEHLGDSLRDLFRRTFGKGIQSRWFN